MFCIKTMVATKELNYTKKLIPISCIYRISLVPKSITSIGTNKLLGGGGNYPKQEHMKKGQKIYLVFQMGINGGHMHAGQG